MSADSFGRIKEILIAARELAGAEQSAFLDKECGSDAVLRAEVVSLLARDSDVASLLATAGAARLTPSLLGGLDAALPSKHPEQIGLYRIAAVLGEGGMGTVYRAEQTAPIHREVALKLIRRGLDTDRIIARFEAERQALALMDHPHIAKVLDAGATEDGRPYFVMELVRGTPITRFCDERALSLRQRLELFAGVCHGVQHAHQKGIIHRDLKPSNVLVLEQDGVMTPRIIDFGIAKAITDPHDRAALLTEVGHVVGTPEYMSPEQAGVTNAGVDTRTDVYSLGVVLYELLTGRRPFEFPVAPTTEVQRGLRETDPPKPSAASASDHVRRQLAGDLDNIVMKALARVPGERYDSVEQFADDIRRHLEGLPVRARHATWTYRSSKFIRRHRVAVTAAAAILVAVVGGTAAAAVGFVQARRERDRADLARSEAEAAAEFLGNMISSANPALRGRDVMVRDVLKDATERLDRDFAGRPILQARLRHEIGRTLLSLRLTREGCEQLRLTAQTRRAELGPADPATVDTLNFLVRCTADVASVSDAEVIALQLEDACRQNPTPFVCEKAESAIGTVRRLQGRSAEQESAYRRAVHWARQWREPTDRFIVDYLSQVAQSLQTQRRLDEAEAVLGEAVDLGMRTPRGAEQPATIGAMGALGRLHMTRGRPVEAERVMRDVVAVSSRVFGAQSGLTGVAFEDLGELYAGLGRFQEAKEMFSQAVIAKRREYGERHPSTLNSANSLATTLRDLREFEEAGKLHLETVALARRYLPSHWYLGKFLRDYSILLQRTGKTAEAERLAREGYEQLALRAVLGAADPDTKQAAAVLVDIYEKSGRGTDAALWRTRAQ